MTLRYLRTVQGGVRPLVWDQRRGHCLTPACFYTRVQKRLKCRPRPWKKTRSEQIFSALVSTDLARPMLTDPNCVEVKPCVTLKSLRPGQECRRTNAAYCSARNMYFTSIICFLFFFSPPLPVPVRSPSTSGTSEDIAKPYKHP